MVIGVLQVQLAIDWAQSRKDKRRVVSSLKDRLHREHQVSVAEVGMLDCHQTAILGIAVASNNAARCQSVLDHVLNKIRYNRQCVLSDHATEIISAGNAEQIGP